ncbi:MAG: glycosyltransferase family 4 protein [Planctomycetota bacterium]
MASPHVLILVENLPVPFDRRVWMESLALRDAGYRVSVISPCPPQHADEPDQVIEGIHVYRYPPPAPTSGKLSFIREFAYCYRETSKLSDRIWKEQPFDAIHSCNPPDTFWKIAKRYKSRGVKFVFDHHDLCPELYESKFDRRDALWRGLVWLERKQFETADAVISTNESYRQVALSRGGKSPADVEVVRSGPMLKRFRRVEPRHELKRGRDHLIAYLGVMGPQDGVDYALRAVRHFLDSGRTDAQFAFIGSGDEFEALQALSRELDLESFVEFTGRISDEDLATYLSTASIGLAPDPKNPLNDVSTMNKIIEYMAMELPVVSFDLAESKYSAADAAVYVDANDERAFASAIAELLDDEQRRTTMGQIGRKRVEQELAWDHSRQVLVDFYDRLLRGGTRG